MEQILPHAILFLSGVTPLSGVLHHLVASAMPPNWCNAPSLVQGCPAWLDWHVVGAAKEQAFPHSSLLLSSVAPLSAALH